ncbi:MAG: T9SS type A sorting domain-containing protein [Bacteroidales bacterium]|nr:T9SS type A sorting domain-containing protein [Bacteroidales bacterium]
MAKSLTINKVHTWAIAFVLSLCPMVLPAQNISVSAATGQNIGTFVQNNLIGDGVYVFNVKFNNNTGNIATPQIGTFNSNGYVQLFMDEGVLMTTGNVSVAPGPNNGGSASQSVANYYSDSQLSSIASGSINGCATLDFDFVSISPFVTVNYCFGSEEYPEYVCSSFNDVFAFFVTGPNPTTGQTVTRNAAIIPHSASTANPNGVAVAINSVNSGSAGSNGGGGSGCIYTYTQYYVSNTWNTGVQYDGFTRKLAASTVVTPCAQYHMHISICNVGDNAYDSGVFLEKRSFNSPSAQVNLSNGEADTVMHSHPHTVPLTVSGSDYNYGMAHVTFGGEARCGVDYWCITATGDTLSPSGDSLLIVSPTQGLTVVGRPGVVFSHPKTAEVYLQTSLCQNFPELLTFDTLRFVFIEDDIVALRDTIIEAVDTCKMVGVEVAYATRPLSFQWIPEDGIDHPRQQYSTALITENAEYSVIATDDVGNADTARVQVVVTPNAIDNAEPMPQLAVYPNPADEVLHIEADGLQRVRILSADGRCLIEAPCIDAVTIDASGLEAGVYTISATTLRGMTTSRVVVVK